MNNLTHQFHGYFCTPLIWDNTIEGIEQFSIQKIDEPQLTIPIPRNLKLGHLVEYFVKQEFYAHPSIEIIAQNIQVNGDKETLGEFDFFIRSNNSYYQIEVAYKFYLYDPKVGESAIDHWIGPNRKDNLKAKLQKINERQFPLLHHPKSANELAIYSIPVKDVVQRCYFKGQLFLPENCIEDVTPLNSEAIAGYYLHFNQIESLSDCKIYIPSKHDWISDPHSYVDWLSYVDAKAKLEESINQNRSKMIWIKNKQGNLRKAFVVWW